MEESSVFLVFYIESEDLNFGQMLSFWAISSPCPNFENFIFKRKFKLYLLLLLLFCVYMSECVCVCAHEPQHVWNQRVTFLESGLPSTVGSRDWTHSFRVACKHFHLLSHLESPGISFLLLDSWVLILNACWILVKYLSTSYYIFLVLVCGYSELHSLIFFF